MISSTLIKVVLPIAIVLGIISLAGVIALIVVWQTKLSPFQDFSVVVDAGFHTLNNLCLYVRLRVHLSSSNSSRLYRWPADKSDGLGLTSRVNQVKACDVPGGPISSVTDPTENNVRQYFQTAMTDCVNTIPSTRKGRALIFLGATAGLRVIELQNSSYVMNLLNATRAYFATLQLLFAAPENQVRIISGSEEGLSGWISTNILTNELYTNNQPLETYGVSDLGGASTQLSFIAPNATSNRFDMNLFNTNYSVYSYSYLCYGTEQTRLVYLSQLVNQANGPSTIDDPCLQPGYNQSINASVLFGTPCVQYNWSNTSITFVFRGTGNTTACTIAMQGRFNKPCASGLCSFDNVYQPVPISTSLKFLGISAWYPTFQSLANRVPLQPNTDNNYNFISTNLTQIKAAITQVCNEPWSNINDSSKYRPLLCFNSMYQWTLFEYGYSMTNDNLKNFQIVKTIDSNDIGWTLGYMINQTNYLNPEFRPPRLLTQSEFAGLLVMCLVVLVISVIVILGAIVAFKRQRSYGTKIVYSNTK